MAWEFQEPSIPQQGNFRARIHAAVWDVSKRTGKDMVVITLKLSGQKPMARYWIANDIGAQIFCRAFNLNPYDISTSQPEKINSWFGADGAVTITHEQTPSGALRAVAKPISRKQAQNLPPFVDADALPQSYQQQQQPQSLPQEFQNFEQSGFNQQQPQQPRQYPPRQDFNANTTNLSNPEIPF